MKNAINAAEFAKSHKTDSDWVRAMGSNQITPWAKGDKITANGYAGSVVDHYRNGMFTVRLPGGTCTVCHSAIKAA